MNASAATETTVYYAVPADIVGNYTVKLNVHYGTNSNDPWEAFVMTKTDKTYFGKYIYTHTFSDKYDGLGRMQIQLYNGDTHMGQQQPIGSGDNDSWTTVSTYNGKMWEHDMGWRAYNYDKTVTIHAKKTSSWTPTNVHNYFNDGTGGENSDVSETNFPGHSTTQSTLNSDWYDYVITGRPCTTVIVNNGKSGVSNQSGNVEIGDNSEYWISYDGNNTTPSTTPPADFNYTRTVTSGNFGTICLPYAATVTGATVFQITNKVMNGDNITGINLESVDNLEAGHAYIFKATSDELVATLFGNKAEAATGNALLGNLGTASITVPQGNYVVGGDNKIHKVTGDAVNCGVYKGYIIPGNIGTSAARGTYFIGSDEETTGIEGVQLENAKNAVYNLQGQRVKETSKGMFIVNGKKVIMK